MTEKDKRLAKARVYHRAMKLIFESLIQPGKDGVELISGDGRVRSCHPILAGASLDYPEQCLCAAVRYGECPICGCHPSELGDFAESPLRKQSDTLKILARAKKKTNWAALNSFLKEYGISPVFEPFWSDLPHANIHASITPDTLHQLFQGMIRHLTKWLQRIVGPKELDQRLQRLPPNHALRIYHSGISSFSTMSGNEHRQLTKQLLGCLVGIVDSQTIHATRALIDFVYLAQYQSHSDDTLTYLEDALHRFHQSKDIFLSLNARGGTYTLDLSRNARLMI